MARALRFLVFCSQISPRFTSRAVHHGFPNLVSFKQISGNSIMPPKFSAGADELQLMSETQALLESEWILDKDEMGVEKTYYFKTYTKAHDFLSTIVIRSKSKNHHSEMTIKTGSVHVHWTTHNPRGLSAKDTFMAQYCDEQAKLIGTVEQSQAQKCGPAPQI